MFSPTISQSMREAMRRAGPPTAGTRPARDTHRHGHLPRHADAVLRFALAAGSRHLLNVHIVGVTLILAGGLGPLLPQSRVAPADRLRR